MRIGPAISHLHYLWCIISLYCVGVFCPRAMWPLVGRVACVIMNIVHPFADAQPTPTPSLSSSPVSTYVTSSSSSSPSSSPPPSLPSSLSSLSPSPSPQPTLPSCRPDCSLTFCADGRNRYCSAAG